MQEGKERKEDSYTSPKEKKRKLSIFHFGGKKDNWQENIRGKKEEKWREHP